MVLFFKKEQSSFATPPAADELAYISQHDIHLDHDQRWTGSGELAYTAFAETTYAARLSADLIVGSVVGAPQFGLRRTLLAGVAQRF